LGTVATLPKETTHLHERGTWSSRDDRIASAIWLGIFWVGTAAGFGLDLRRYFHERPAPPLIVHVHAVVFTLWLLILTTQVLSVMSNRIDWHRKFGWFAAGWACLMAVVGPWAVMTSLAVNQQSLDFTPWFLSVNIVSLGGFVILTGWGLVLRKNPAAHKRVMMLALVVFADPGFSRLTDYFVPGPRSVLTWFVYTLYGNFALLALMALWDWHRGRLMRQFVVGGAGVVTAYVAAWGLYFWEPWRALTLAWVQTWARLGPQSLCSAR
jgi:hypothetical protein